MGAGGLVREGVIGEALSILLYAVAGVAAGVAAAAMMAAAGAYSRLITSVAAGVPVNDVGLLTESTPSLAVLAGLSSVLALALAFAVPEVMGASIDELLDEYHHRGAEPDPRAVAVKLAATPIAVGGGVPVGIVGPAVYVGGSVGGLLGKFLRAGFGLRRRLFIAGVAGAVSWGLRAPLGAVFFALEIPYHRDLEGGADTAVASAVGSFSSFITSTAFLGPPHITASMSSAHPLGYVVGVLVVGVLAGVLGKAFSRIYHLGIGVRRGGPIATAVLAPSVTVALVMISPVLAGGGLAAASSLVSAASPLPAAAALLLLALRLGVSPLLSGLGVPGGLFGPGMVTGALLGLAVHSVTGLADPVSLAVVGMASLYGSVSTAPIGLSIIAAEVSGNYFLAVPSLIAALLAREVLGSDYLYINQKERRLRSAIALARDLAELLKRAGVGDVRVNCSGGGAPAVVVDSLSPGDVLPSIDVVPSVVVVGSSVAGVVSEESLSRYLLGEGGLVERVPITYCGASLFDVVDLMVRSNSPFVVLVGEGHYLLGVEDVLGWLSKKGVEALTRDRVGTR